jgi:hypothetical protein
VGRPGSSLPSNRHKAFVLARLSIRVHRRHVEKASTAMGFRLDGGYVLLSLQTHRFGVAYPLLMLCHTTARFHSTPLVCCHLPVWSMFGAGYVFIRGTETCRPQYRFSNTCRLQTSGLYPSRRVQAPRILSGRSCSGPRTRVVFVGPTTWRQWIFNSSYGGLPLMQRATATWFANYKKDCR